MAFIDFLKYGAIGISLALAILSYRLLAKEQDKETIRVEMLTSIKQYFMLSVFLSVFFGLLELVGQKWNNNPTTDNTALMSLWGQHFDEFKVDTAEQLKIHRIVTNYKKEISDIDTILVCSEISSQYEQCQKELDAFDQGFYQNIVKLKKAISQDPDGWLNIAFETSNKQNALDPLKEIYQSLDIAYDTQNDSILVNNWKQLKGTWTDKKLKYIFQSDISPVVKKFIDQYN